MTKSRAIIDSVVSTGGDSKRKVVRGLCTEWRRADGKLHRLDGPAIEWKNGTKEWWVNGKLHRIGAPALEWDDGTRQWWFNGKLHRLDGPAYEGASGTKEWHMNGKRHRTDGPAVEHVNGTRQWWVNDTRLSEEEFNLYVDQDTGEVFIPPGKKLRHYE